MSVLVKIKDGLYVNPRNVTAVESTTNKDACNIVMVNGHSYHVYLSAGSVRSLFEGNTPV